MSTISDRYVRVADRFVALVKGVPDGAWGNPSPCEEWTARDVVQHVVDNHPYFLRLVGIDPVEAPPVAEDPLSAIDAVTRQMASVLADPALAGRTYDGHFGTRTLEWAVDRFLADDLVVHGWDLARATGGDESIPPEEVETVMAHSAEWGDAMRGPGAMGPALDPPPDADAQVRLLAHLGRAAW